LNSGESVPANAVQLNATSQMICFESSLMNFDVSMLVPVEQSKGHNG